MQHCNSETLEQYLETAHGIPSNERKSIRISSGIDHNKMNQLVNYFGMKYDKTNSLIYSSLLRVGYDIFDSVYDSKLQEMTKYIRGVMLSDTIIDDDPFVRLTMKLPQLKLQPYENCSKSFCVFIDTKTHARIKQWSHILHCPISELAAYCILKSVSITSKELTPEHISNDCKFRAACFEKQIDIILNTRMGN